MTAWRALLDMDPTSGVAFKALSNLYLARRDWDGLAGLHDELLRPDQLAALLERVVGDHDPPTRVDLWMRIGRLHRDRLGKPRQAVRAFLAVLDLVPDHLEAARALAPLLGDDDPATLARVLGVLLGHGGDDGKRLDHAHRLAEIQERDLDDAAAALATRLDVLPLEWRAPGARRELERLAQAQGAGERLAARYQEIYAGAAADPVELQREKASLMLAAARVLDAAGRGDAALDVLRSVLALDEANPVPLLLESLALDAGGMGEHTSARLMEILRALADQAAGPARIALLHRVADHEERQGRPAAALEALGQALREDAGDAPTLAGLERLAALCNGWPVLVEVYRAVAGQRLSLDQQVDIRCRLGQLYKDRLDDRDRALVTFQRIVDLAPRADHAVDVLADLYANAGRWSELIELIDGRGGSERLRAVVERSLPGGRRDRMAVQLEVARIYEEHGGDPERAVAEYRRALDIDPASLPALRRLVELYRRLGRTGEQAEAERAAAEAERAADWVLPERPR
jgi:tetratricopeptide (TPR) repeat protein